MKIAFQSPTYKAMEKHGNKIVLTFDHVGQWPEAVRRHRAARICHRRQRPQVRECHRRRSSARDKVEVWSDEVSEPVAVRYAWADNPVCNLYSAEGLPADAVPHRRLAGSDDSQRTNRSPSSLQAGASPRPGIGTDRGSCDRSEISPR